MSKDRVDLKKYIREVADWPKKGILFRDITPLLAEPKVFQAAINALDGKECGGYTVKVNMAKSG